MTAIALPGLPSLAAAFAWLEANTDGRTVVRVVLWRGPCGEVRGSVMLRERRGMAA